MNANKNIIKYFPILTATAVLLSLLLSSCTDSIDMYARGNRSDMVIEVTERGDYDDVVGTRAAYSGTTLSFEEGDRIGVYCCHEGTGLFSNVCFTKNSSGNWVTSSHIEYNDEYTYYAYYPYVASPYAPDFTEGSIDNIFSLFILDGSDKFQKADQSIKANFNASDLMIAEGLKIGSNTVKFTLGHKKSLAVITPSMGLSSFTDNVPYNIGGGTKYFLMKPNTPTWIGGEMFQGNKGYIGQMMGEEIHPLTFIALESGTFTLTIPANVTTSDLTSVSYSLNNGETWTTTANSNSAITITTPTVAAGNKVLWKGSGKRMAVSENDYSNFSSTGRFEASGNIMSMINGDNFTGTNLNTNAAYNYAFTGLFSGCTGLTTPPLLTSEDATNSCYLALFKNCTNLTEAPSLPARTVYYRGYKEMFMGCTSLTTAPEIKVGTNLNMDACVSMFEGCTSLTTPPSVINANNGYSTCYQMFKGCTSLTTTPTLPATMVGQGVYRGMFRDCTSLTTAPSLPAITLSDWSYAEMFQGCTSLTTAPTLPVTTIPSNCYNSMFEGCTSLTTAPSLPATSVGFAGYLEMFKDCTSLTTAPSLPAATLGERAYEKMFNNCTNMTSAPALPATTMTSSCYNAMFQGCTALTTAPALNSTTLAETCYQYMFAGCTSLTTAPTLPATTLQKECYRSMFSGCASLTTAPTLPAATMMESCYWVMFQGCSSLNYVKMLATNIIASNCLQGYLQNVSPFGTFVKAPSMTSLPTNDSGIPQGWAVVNEGDEQQEYLTFTALESGTFTLTIGANVPTTSLASVSYSTDNGNTWVKTNNVNSSTVTITTPTIAAGRKVLWKGSGKAMATGYGSGQYSQFSSTGRFNASGSVTSILFGAAKGIQIEETRCFEMLFQNCTKLISAENLVFPPDRLSDACFDAMFMGCTGLTTAPASLPATQLARGCYCNMFKNCSALTTAPTLPAATLANNCYQYMFQGCTSLSYIKMLATDISASSCLSSWVSGVSASGTFVKSSSMTSLPTGANGIPSGWTIQNE